MAMGFLTSSSQSLPQARGKVASNGSEGVRWSYPEKKNFKLILSDLVGFSVFVFLHTYRDVHYATITQYQGNNIEKNSPFIPKSILCVTIDFYLFETVYLFLTIYNALNELLKTTPMACWGEKCVSMEINA